MKLTKLTIQLYTDSEYLHKVFSIGEWVHLKRDPDCSEEELLIEGRVVFYSLEGGL